ncbi:MAG: hypothetical protein NC131_03340 [Roseburia sp.]|nr:hypothetical protein [Roseburia sp.]
MKKFLLTALLTLPALFCLSACKKSVNYFSYVSEYRKSVYIYRDDTVSIKIYSVDKETPYSLDGFKGAVENVTEVYFGYSGNADEVEIELLGQGGEMSWLAVTRNYYLSFSGAETSGASIPVTVRVDGQEKNYDVFNVAEEGTIDGKTALDCVREYDGEAFSSLSDGDLFAGEIIIRLLYDEGCYYYVGLCNREAQVHAYLVNGADGRIIAEHTSPAE